MTQKLLIKEIRHIELDDFDLELQKFGIKIINNEDVIRHMSRRSKSKNVLFLLLQNLKGGRSFNRGQIEVIKRFNGEYDNKTDSWVLTMELES